MRKTLLTLAATAGLIGLGAVGASAAPVAPAHVPAQATSHIQQADWYCGPRCQYWRHRRWEESHWHHRPYYGYNRGYYAYNPYYYR
jgi:hypothetical protein